MMAIVIIIMRRLRCLLRYVIRCKRRDERLARRFDSADFDATIYYYPSLRHIVVYCSLRLLRRLFIYYHAIMALLMFMFVLPITIIVCWCHYVLCRYAWWRCLMLFAARCCLFFFFFFDYYLRHFAYAILCLLDGYSASAARERRCPATTFFATTITLRCHLRRWLLLIFVVDARYYCSDFTRRHVAAIDARCCLMMSTGRCCWCRYACWWYFDEREHAALCAERRHYWCWMIWLFSMLRPRLYCCLLLRLVRHMMMLMFIMPAHYAIDFARCWATIIIVCLMSSLMPRALSILICYFADAARAAVAAPLRLCHVFVVTRVSMSIILMHCRYALLLKRYDAILWGVIIHATTTYWCHYSRLSYYVLIALHIVIRYVTVISVILLMLFSLTLLVFTPLMPPSPDYRRRFTTPSPPFHATPLSLSDAAITFVTLSRWYAMLAATILFICCRKMKDVC